MQFKGTPNYPAEMMDKAVARDGGMRNAFTFLDWTTYFETMPADKIDLALRLEADRMVNSAFDEKEFSSERTVVISEREGNENEPMFLLGEAVQQAAFRVHSYHHEIIGDMADLRSLTRDDLYRHYRNLLRSQQCRHGCGRRLSSSARCWPASRNCSARSLPAQSRRGWHAPEPEQRGEARVTIEGPGQTTYLEVAYRFPAAAHPDFYALSVLDSLLAGPSNLNMFGGGGISNKTSRLYRALVDKQYVVGFSGGANATIDPFLYYLSLTVHPKRKPEEALAALDEQIRKVQEELVHTRGDPARHQAGTRQLRVWNREHHQSGLLAWLCRDVRHLMIGSKRIWRNWRR